MWAPCEQNPESVAALALGQLIWDQFGFAKGSHPKHTDDVSQPQELNGLSAEDFQKRKSDVGCQKRIPSNLQKVDQIVVERL